MISASQENAPVKQASSIAMQTPVVVSILFHITVVLGFMVGFPYVNKDKAMLPPPPMSVEIIDADELAQTKKQAKAVKPKDKKKPPPKKSKPKSAPRMTAMAPPDLSMPKPPEIEVTEDTKEISQPKPLKRKILKKPKPPKPRKPETTKTVQPKKKDDFQSLLKNLAPDAEEVQVEPEQNKKTNKAQAEPAQIAPLAARLTMSEQDALRRQLAGCWNVLAGAKYAENLIVEVRAFMNPDRTVQRADILNKSRYNSDIHFQAAADAALRALRNPRCSPLLLPADKYDQWKTIVLTFDPRDML